MNKLNLYRNIFKNSDWKTTQNNVASNIADWLFHTASLTQKLQTVSQNISVEITQEDWQAVSLSNNFAKYSQEQTAWVREIVLKGDSSPWIFAQTVFPRATIENVAQEILQLGEKPIGLWLFPQNPIRQSLEWTFDSKTGLYARRSLLLLKDYPLEIYELFLAEFPFEPNSRKE
ncbi:chorismate--pyruvate lyase family protein [Otariodibacter oris]|uniref:Probable chorismate pyruvate-lyase n=1 Tax=Otariodibacter oris TaxID=1032623 RepID=A0A420XF43_9PAST|nr:chorismate lyase [Otariodibacter oris]QGM81545.1 4-hydroxybenzoate synthetase [Otariodibacter oris]RKR71155.1 chorismate lyase [Otariodibacter oris]